MTRLHESVASLPAVSEGNGIFDVTVIRPGWGSSGYYSESMLQEHGPRVFTKGRPMFANHPTEAEFSNGRDITKIMAKIHENARWDDGVLKAKIKVGAPYREFVEEYMDTIGLSIFAEGDGETGEVDGRKGFIVESLNADDRYASLDFVVAAGAGGKVEEKLLESFRAASAEADSDAATAVIEDTKKEKQTMDELKALIEALSSKMDAKFVAIEAKVDSIVTLSEQASAAATDKVDAFQVADELSKAVAEAKLPEEGRARVLEAVRDNGKTVAEAVASEKAYIKSITESISKTNTTAYGRVVESGESTFSLKTLTAVK